MANLQHQIERLKAQLKGKEAEAKKQARRDDTRRKIIYGAAILAQVEELPGEPHQNVLSLLHDRVTRPADRAFLGLPPRPQPAPNRSTAPAVAPGPAAPPPRPTSAPPAPGAPRGEAKTGELPFAW